MRKIYALFCVLLIVFCLALGGCASDVGDREAGRTNENSVTDHTPDEKISDVAETVSSGGILQEDDDSYADDAAQDLVSNTVEESEGVLSGNPDSDETSAVEETNAEQISENAAEPDRTIADYIGDWDGGERGEMSLHAIETGYGLSIRFYRLVNMDVTLVNQDEPDGSWRFEGDGFIVHAFPEAETITLSVEDTSGSFDSSFSGIEFLFVRNGNALDEKAGADNSDETEEPVESDGILQEDDDSYADDAAQDRAASTGYQFYENELFSTEVPADWEIQKVKVQYFADTITQPHEGKDRWSSIIINGGGYYDGDVEALDADYHFDHNFYEATIAGQPAKIIERGGGELGISARDIYTAAPDGTRFILHFTCPDGGVAYDFSGISEAMEHFIDHMQFK